MAVREISHYQIIERLGQGGMGVVYRAHDLKLDRDVAIKLLPSSDTTDPELKSRFILEAKTASAIDHPNIGTIYEIDETPDGELFIVMSFLEGETLRSIIGRGPLSVETACDYALQIAHGMAKAHAKHIIHRDLKPANVMITTDGIAKIIDFGLAKLVGGMQLTSVGTTVGTLAYMAPEQLRGNEPDPSCDIWALGVMLYEMLAGVTPFRGEFEAALVYSIGNEEPPPIETHRDGLPPPLRDLVGALLRKDPSQRPASMDEVVKILHGEAHVSQARISTAGQPAVTGPAETKRAVPFYRKWWLYGVGLLLWIIVGVFLYSILTPPSTRRMSPGLSKSIAILPCTFTGGQEGSFLGDAISAEIRRYLLKSPGVMAISSSSTQYFSERSSSDSALFFNLGVNFLLKGQVRLTSAGLTLDLSLVSKEGNEEAWERHYAYAQKEIHLLPPAVSADLAGVLDLPPITIRPVETTDRPDVYQWYLEGLHYYDVGEDRSSRKMAREYFTNAVNNDSDFIPALLGLAGVRLTQREMGWDKSGGTLGEIETICWRIIGLDSTNASAYALLGKVLDRSGDRSGGMQFLERALAIDPYNLTALRFLSEIYMIELGDPIKGLVIFEKLQWIEPASWWVKLSLGVAHAQMNDFEGGISLFRNAASLNPQHPYPLFNLGYAFEHLSNADSAEWYYRKSIEADSTFSSPISSLAGLLIAQRRYGEADSLLEGARKAVEGDPDLLYLHGIVESCRGRTSEAKTIYRSGREEVRDRLRQQPSEPGLLAYEGLYSVRLGERIDPAGLAREILRIDSIHEESILGVVRLYALTRDKERMLEWFGRVRKMNRAEYNEGWLKTAVDFEYFRSDPDLLKMLKN